MTPPTLQDFYQEVANPLLTAVAFKYPSNAVEEVTQDNFHLLFKGSEMVVAGKLRDQSPDVLSAKVSGQLVSVVSHPGEKGSWLVWPAVLERKGSWSRHSQGLGSNPSFATLQLIDHEQVTQCPLPLVDDIGPYCMGS